MQRPWDLLLIVGGGVFTCLKLWRGVFLLLSQGTEIYTTIFLCRLVLPHIIPFLRLGFPLVLFIPASSFWWRVTVADWSLFFFGLRVCTIKRVNVDHELSLGI